MTKDLECYAGWTDVGIFIYFDNEITLEDCQECNPPDADDENIIAYYFEVRESLLTAEYRELGPWMLILCELKIC